MKRESGRGSCVDRAARDRTSTGVKVKDISQEASNAGARVTFASFQRDASMSWGPVQRGIFTYPRGVFLEVDIFAMH